jgi:hypothetical protein
MCVACPDKGRVVQISFKLTHYLQQGDEVEIENKAIA